MILPKICKAFQLGVFLTCGAALSAPFTITDRTSDLPAGNPVLDALNANADLLETQINNGFMSESSRTTFNAAMANASTSPGSGLWVDRASNMDRFNVGFGVQAQVNMSSLSASALSFSTDNALPPIGGGAVAAVTIGLNPLLFGKSKKSRSDKLFLYLNGMYLNTSVSTAEITASQIGLNAQYRLISPKRLLLLGWGGITLATGVNYASSYLGVSSNLQVSSDTDVSGQTVSVTLDLDYELGIRSSMITVPLEVSTNVNFFYIFTLFLGAAADINVGSASLTGTATGPVAATYTGAFSGNLFSGTGNLNLDDGVVSRPNSVIGRFFAGLQFNVLLVKVAASYTYLTNQSHGLSLVTRVAM